MIIISIRPELEFGKYCKAIASKNFQMFFRTTTTI